MNLKFWKKKQMPEESDNSAADETIVATETDRRLQSQASWTRLKSTLIPSRKKSEPDVKMRPSPPRVTRTTSIRMKNLKPPPSRVSWLDLKAPNAFTQKRQNRGRRKARRTQTLGQTHRQETSGGRTDTSAIPAKKPGKQLVIALALLIPLAAGGGFFAATEIIAAATAPGNTAGKGRGFAGSKNQTSTRSGAHRHCRPSRCGGYRAASGSARCRKISEILRHTPGWRADHQRQEL